MNSNQIFFKRFSNFQIGGTGLGLMYVPAVVSVGENLYSVADYYLWFWFCSRLLLWQETRSGHWHLSLRIRSWWKSFTFLWLTIWLTTTILLWSEKNIWPPSPASHHAIFTCPLLLSVLYTPIPAYIYISIRYNPKYFKNSNKDNLLRSFCPSPNSCTLPPILRLEGFGMTWFYWWITNRWRVWKQMNCSGDQRWIGGAELKKWRQWLILRWRHGFLLVSVFSAQSADLHLSPFPSKTF